MYWLMAIEIHQKLSHPQYFAIFNAPIKFFIVVPVFNDVERVVTDSSFIISTHRLDFFSDRIRRNEINCGIIYE